MKPMKRQIAEAFPPGDMLQEKLEEIGMPIKEFALRCGKPEPTIHDVLKGRSAVTPDMAILFEKVLGIPARLWLNLQCQYDEYKARLQHDEELQKNLEWVKFFPFADMVEKGYIQADKRCSPLEKLQTILSFFGFAKTNVWVKYYQCQTLKAEFRLALAGMPDAYALSAWLRYGENKAQEIHDMPEYTSEGIKGNPVDKLRLFGQCPGSTLPKGTSPSLICRWTPPAFKPNRSVRWCKVHPTCKFHFNEN